MALTPFNFGSGVVKGAEVRYRKSAQGAQGAEGAQVTPELCHMPIFGCDKALGCHPELSGR